MNLVIPLLNTSINNYFELRYAIRSACKHNRVERCVLVGGKPIWYTGDHVLHVDYDKERKEENIRDKVVAGAKYLKLTTKAPGDYIGTGDVDFLFMNDDHFMLSPYQWAHNKGLLSATLKNRQPNGIYTRLLQNTFDHFGDVPNADTHCPLRMSNHGVERTVFDWPRFGLGFKTTYCQLNNIQTTYHIDHKVGDLSLVPPDAPYFSTTGYYKGAEKLLEMFPEKSIFER